METANKIIGIAFIFAFIGVTLAALKAKNTSTRLSAIKPKIPLTKNEQPMYFRLNEAFPEHVILAQVAFSALIDTRDRATRNAFNRKVADFVLCTKAFEVLAIIELDDSSHRNKRDADSKRDAMLMSAGYKTLRYKRVPNTEELKRAINQTASTPASSKPVKAI